MYLEISNGIDKPQLHRLDRSTYFIGSLAESDIYIRDKEVSRKHLTLIFEDGKYYVIDRGSLNGTFLDDKRLEPGKRVEFPEFANLRLGTRILISLVRDEDKVDSTSEFRVSLEPETSDQTRQISLVDLKKAKTEDLVKKKKQIKAQPKKKKKKIEYRPYVILASFALLGFAYTKRDMLQEKFLHGDEAVAGSAVEKPKRKKVLLVSEKKIRDSFLIQPSMIQDMFPEPKCSEEVERKLCDQLKVESPGTYGVRKFSDTYIIYVDATNFIDEAKATLIEGHDKDIEKLAVMFYLFHSTKNSEAYPLVQKHNLVFAFYYQGEYRFAMGLKGDYLKELDDKILESHFGIARRIGMSIFKYSNDYISLY